LLFERDEFIK
jgi:hypothetical protein